MHETSPPPPYSPEEHAAPASRKSPSPANDPGPTPPATETTPPQRRRFTEWTLPPYVLLVSLLLPIGLYYTAGSFSSSPSRPPWTNTPPARVTWDGPLIPDKSCLSYGTRWYTAHMSSSHVPPGHDPLESCRNTLGHAHGQSALPQKCRLDSARGMLHARFKFDEDPTCGMARWENVRPDYRCKEYGKKRYTGILKDVPEGLDGLDVCKKVRYPFFGLRDKNLAPERCEVEVVAGKAKVVGSWTVDFHVPECQPVVRGLEDKGCIGAHRKRVTGWLDGLGKDEDQSHMCMTTPIVWDGDKYLPEMCEARTAWNTYQWATYYVWDPRCH